MGSCLARDEDTDSWEDLLAICLKREGKPLQEAEVADKPFLVAVDSAWDVSRREVEALETECKRIRQYVLDLEDTLAEMKEHEREWELKLQEQTDQTLGLQSEVDALRHRSTQLEELLWLQKDNSSAKPVAAARGSVVKSQIRKFEAKIIAVEDGMPPPPKRTRKSFSSIASGDTCDSRSDKCSTNVGVAPSAASAALVTVVIDACVQSFTLHVAEMGMTFPKLPRVIQLEWPLSVGHHQCDRRPTSSTQST
eukprot:CAMPEP_0194497942 /NCGR_PEP_ID=MMETSP0253-20130528/14727_1 /TAXON_ID=2966 /ORGANISM="Noctiluca scintillans" /LENGTH=251 /DNA_ID=CAMNT_0039339507 /DNA_START=10 /DNA_END=766 /DNA_ORIENTATION=-